MLTSIKRVNRNTLFLLTMAAGGTLLPKPGLTQSSETVNRVTLLPTDSKETKIQKAAHVRPSARQMTWQQYEVTGFVHFGMNTFTDREWGDGTEDPKLFNPVQLDARQWVKAAKDFGMKELVMTTKHHDGFCLWPTKTSNHSVKSSPWKEGKGDVIREVANACKEYGLKFGVYLSPWDRNQAKYGVYGSDAYNELFRTQLRELLTQYGPIAEVWFDGANGEGKNGKKQVYDWESYYKLVRELQPNAVISISGPDVRWVGNEAGEGRDTEWSVVPISASENDRIAANSQQEAGSGVFIPAGDRMDNDLGSRAKVLEAQTLIWYPAVVNNSFRPGWFYHAKEDGKQRNVAKLMDNYYASVGKNAVWLLNFSPDKRGLLNEDDVKTLHAYRQRFDKVFSRNLTAGATVQATNGRSGSKAQAVVDKQFDTYWTTPEAQTTGALELTWKKPVTVDQILLQEHIANGQRVESFVVEAFDGQSWQELSKGTTIGYKRILRFKPTTTRQLRVRILESRANPEIANLELYANPVE